MMKNLTVCTLAALVSIATTGVNAEAATRAHSARPARSALNSDRKQVGAARVKLMNDSRRFGPSSPQVQADKRELISALEKLKADSARTPATQARQPRRPAHHAVRARARHTSAT